MDLLNIIKSKSESFLDTESELGLDAVIHHIEIAETHFKQAHMGNEYLYTDVIYRTNQAFEGSLKEAYRILASKEPARQTPAKIEKFLEAEGVLKDRILRQFSDYRTDWRNKSTHDYQLLFSAQEALLAIVSVSAFCTILLDQMLEKRAYDIEVRKISSMPMVFNIEGYDDLDFLNQCVELLAKFSSDLKAELIDKKELNEYELLGKISGFIATVDPTINITTEFEIPNESYNARGDMLLQKGGDKLIVEIKRGVEQGINLVNRGVNQLELYMNATGIERGIVFIPPMSEKQIIVKQKYLSKLNNGKSQIVSLYYELT